METLTKVKEKVKESGRTDLFTTCWDAMKLFNDYHTHDLYITKSFEQFFGRVVLRLKVELPELELTLLGQSKVYGPKDRERLKDFMISNKMGSFNELYVDYEIKSKNEFVIDPYKHGYADSECDGTITSLEALVKHMFEDKKIRIHYEDETNP
jgi:hypothetical protein